MNAPFETVMSLCSGPAENPVDGSTGGRQILGILTHPRSPPVREAAPGVLLLNAGLVHRVGPQRLHVRLARDLANAGFTTLRFDFSGIGDSPGDGTNPLFSESPVEETRLMMDELAATHGINHFIVVGLCLGADIAFRVACRDERVIGVIPINGYCVSNDVLQPIGFEASQRTYARYYRKKAVRADSIRRLVSGKSQYRAILRSLTTKLKQELRGSRWGHNIAAQSSSTSTVASAQVHTDAWTDLENRSVAVKVIYAEGSTALDVFELTHGEHVREMARRGDLELDVIPETDHVFTEKWAQDRLCQLVLGWIEKRAWPNASGASLADSSGGKLRSITDDGFEQPDGLQARSTPPAGGGDDGRC